MKIKRRSMRHRHLWFSVWTQDPLKTMIIEDVNETPMKISGR